MMRTAPCRRTILQCSHRTLTDGLTFMLVTSYLNRYVIRPRVRSYGDSSTLTLSPGRIRMKCMRILPETWASTLCPLSNSTRNIAFGSGSTTVPSTSIASSLAIVDIRLFHPRQDAGAAGRDRDGVFEMSRQAAVYGDRCPAVLEHPHLAGPHRDHRLDGQNHPGLQNDAAPRIAEIGHLRLLVQRPTDPVSDDRAHDREAVALAVRLHAVRNVAEAVPDAALNDGLVQALARDVQQLLSAGRDAPDGQRDRTVGVVVIHDAPEIEPDYVAITQLACRRRNAVDDLLV